MATTKLRINISVPKEMERAVLSMAKRDAVPVATKARELMEVGLQLEENEALVDIIREREKHGKTVPFDVLWQKYMR